MYVYLKPVKLLFFVATLLICFCSAMAGENDDYTWTVNADDSITITKYKGSAEHVVIPSEIDGHTVTVIGAAAFKGNNTIQKVHIPGTVLQIENEAFYVCHYLYRAEFTGNAPIMGHEVFDDCSSSFVVYYYEGSTGFTNPWNGYATGEIPRSTCKKSPGPLDGTTLEAADPIFMGGGNFRNAWTLLDPGEIIPLQFVLQYYPDLKHGATFYSGRSMFPPWNRKSGFSGNVTYFLSRYKDTGTAGEPEVVDVFLGDRTVVFAQKEGGGWECQEPTPYELEKSGDTYFFKDPVGQLVFEFPARAIGSTWVAPYYIIENANVNRIVDRNGNSLSFEYNYDYLPTRITDNMGRELTFTYINATFWMQRHLKTVSDNWGRTVTFDYTDITCGNDQTQILSSVTDSMGNKTTFEYHQTEQIEDCQLIKRIIKPMGNNQVELDWTKNPNEHNAVSSQADGNGNTLNIDYGLEGESIKADLTKADGETKTFVHQDGRYPQSFTDEDGNSFTIAYDPAMRREKVTDRLGGETTYAYDPNSGFVSEITNAANNKTTITYSGTEQTFTDTTGNDSATFTFYNQTRVDYADGTNSARAYDNKGNPNSVTDRTGNTWNYTCNNRGQLLSSENPEDGKAEYTYNADGTIASSTDTDIGITTYGYDLYKRLNSVTRPDTSVTAITYNNNNQILSVKNGLDETWAFEYDTNDNLIGITDPNGKKSVYEYDLNDKLKTTTNPLNKQWSMTYTSLGQLAGITDPTGFTRSYAYDPRGWFKSVTIDGNTWTRTYNDAGCMTGKTFPDGRTLSNDRNSLCWVTAITDPMGNNHALTRNSMGQISNVTDPMDMSTAYEYDFSGRLTSVTLPDSAKSTYTRNKLGALASITDLNGQAWNLTYTKTGLRQGIQDPLGRSKNFSYDQLARLSKITYPDTSTQDITYDKASRPVQRLFSAGPTMNFFYDPVGRLTGTDGLTLAYDDAGQLISLTENSYTVGDTCDDAGRLKTIDYNGVMTVTYTYDPQSGLLQSVSDSLTNSQIGFTYDVNRRLTGLTRSNGQNADYTYNDADRLTQLKDGAILDLEYSYDKAGQITAKKITAPLEPEANLVPEETQQTYDNACQINSGGYTYNANGQCLNDPNRAYEWDGAGRLTKAGETTLTYNGLNVLTRRTASGKNVTCERGYCIPGYPILAERDDAETRLMIYTPNGRLLYMIEKGTETRAYFYHFDLAGSCLALSSSAGTVTDSYAYSPYGRILAHQGNSEQPFTYNGMWGVRLENNDLYQMGARYYDAVTGRFLSKESIWPQTANPHALNPYQFARSAPTNRCDPSGLSGPELNDLWGFNDNSEYEESESLWGRSGWSKVSIPFGPVEYDGGICLACRMTIAPDNIWWNPIARLKGTPPGNPYELYHAFEWWPSSEVIPPINKWSPSQVNQEQPNQSLAEAFNKIGSVQTGLVPFAPPEKTTKDEWEFLMIPISFEPIGRLAEALKKAGPVQTGLVPFAPLEKTTKDKWEFLMIPIEPLIPY